MSIKLELSGPQGNAFYILGLVRNLGRQLNMDNKIIDDIVKKMMSGDYDNLLKIFIYNFGVIVDVYDNGKKYKVKNKKRKLRIRNNNPIFEIVVGNVVPL